MNRLTAWGLALAMGAGLFSAPIAARASEEGERNTALGLTAAAAALLLTQKNKLPGIVAGAGAAYAWKKNQDSINSRHDRERRYGYDRRNDRDDYRYRDNDRYDNNRYDKNDRYRDDNRNRDNDRYSNSRRDPVSGRYPTNNRRDRDRWDDRDDNDNRPPFGRAVGHNKNGKRK
jgi:hypothetical protein